MVQCFDCSLLWAHSMPRRRAPPRQAPADQYTLERWTVPLEQRGKRSYAAFAELDRTAVSPPLDELPDDDDQLCGSPQSAMMRANLRTITMTALRGEVNAYMEAEARRRWGHEYSAATLAEQHLILCAVTRLSPDDVGRVWFGLEDYDVACALRLDGGLARVYSVEVVVLDADNLVDEVRAFLAPRGLAAPHEWMEPLYQVERHLITRVQYMLDTSRREARAHLYNALMTQTGLSRPAPPGGIWVRH